MKQDTRLRRQILVECGLSEKEATLYELLLERGKAAGYELEKNSGLKKNTYSLIKSLVSKHLIFPFKQDGRDYFQPAPPETLLTLIKDRERAVSYTRKSLEQLLPTLNSQYSLSLGKPTVRYFEGEAGLKEVFADIYAPKNEPVYGCVDLEKVDAVFPRYVLNDLIPLRIKNKLIAYSLVADSTQARAIKMNDVKQLRHTLLFDKNMYPLPAEIDVYEDKIALLSFERGRFVGVIIQNQAFATTLKSIFKQIFAAKDQAE